MVAIALVLAIGTGVYAGLGSMENWRKASNDASYAALHAHDLEISLTGGTQRAGGRRCGRSSRASRTAAGSRAVEERLVLPTQVEVVRPGEDPLRPRRQLVGSALGPEGPPVDGVYADCGRGLRAADEGRPVAVLERELRRLPRPARAGSRPVAGGRQLRYVGEGRSPEYFMVTSAGRRRLRRRRGQLRRRLHLAGDRAADRRRPRR